MGRAPARIAAAIHGCCKASRQPPAPATVTEAIRVPAVRQNLRRSIPADTTTAMARGNSILHRSIGVKTTAGIAEQRTTTTLRTA
mgnify:CR=1 FL=1